jgi:hypothetical protein
MSSPSHPSRMTVRPGAQGLRRGGGGGWGVGVCFGKAVWGRRSLYSTPQVPLQMPRAASRCWAQGRWAEASSSKAAQPQQLAADMLVTLAQHSCADAMATAAPPAMDIRQLWQHFLSQASQPPLPRLPKKLAPRCCPSHCQEAASTALSHLQRTSGQSPGGSHPNFRCSRSCRACTLGQCQCMEGWRPCCIMGQGAPAISQGNWPWEEAWRPCHIAWQQHRPLPAAPRCPSYPCLQRSSKQVRAQLQEAMRRAPCCCGPGPLS